MGPQALVYPAGRADKIGRLSYYHPYPNSFDNLRHSLPAAISAACYSDHYFNEPWSPPPVCVNTYMPHSTYPSSTGQDAGYTFTLGANHFATSYDTEPRFNIEDPEFGSLSGDDDAEGFDSNAQLRSQQLNSDGTPKRPMNAFMIFARKRRPMVSSEQPTMRTGEISKILSKEWCEMRKEDKQFYLDQAKKLKDTFNSRWPDYVYRRRPNNSRKRRKLGAAGASSVHDHDVTTSSDAQPEAFIDPSASSQSGDESKSQSTESPFNAQHQLLYTPEELGHPCALDRSPTPASVLTGYARSTSSPYIPPVRPSYLEEPTPATYASQAYPFGDSISMYYGCAPGSGDVDDHSPVVDPHTKNWRSFDAVPSGAVGPNSASTPGNSPLVHATRLSYPPTAQAPSKWAKAGRTNEAHPYEAQSALWGASPLLAGHVGTNSQGVNGVLPSVSGPRLDFTPSGSPNPNALGMRLYDGHEDSLSDSHYQAAYMEPGRFGHLAPPSHNSSTPPPFQDALSPPHANSSSAYFGPTRWAANEHSG